DEVSMREAGPQVASLETRLQGEVAPLAPKLYVDWSSFVEHENFRGQSSSSRKDTFNNIPNTFLERGLFQGDCLVAFCKENPSVKIAHIIVRVSPDNSVQSETGNSYYSLRIGNGPSVIATVRLDCLNYTDG